MLRRVLTIVLTLCVCQYIPAQIVTSIDDGNGIVSAWDDDSEDEVICGWETTLESFCETPAEERMSGCDSAEGLPEITSRSVCVGGVVHSLPSIMLPDGRDLYMLFEEGIERYMSLGPPVFYEGISDDMIRWIRYYAFSKRSSTQKILLKYEHWQEYVEECMTAEGVPTELGLLCLIESGCNSKAKSPVGALGMWQFMPDTAMEMGLEINLATDERTDPVKSTRAAARYLAGAYRSTGSWIMAAASYNCGIGRTQKVMRSEGSTRWDEARHAFPSETQQYIPALQAIYYVWTYRKELGFHMSGNHENSFQHLSLK